MTAFGNFTAHAFRDKPGGPAPGPGAGTWQPDDEVAGAGARALSVLDLLDVNRSAMHSWSLDAA
jgi:3,4-dihydroxy 2-butanone 4-phosphate synthase/GTP cyclohydrolase II